jgi:hypothetical protein
MAALPPTLDRADESFILYGAKRVLDGQALYHDFFEFLTPGSFYLYALAYKIGGTSITSARVTTALLNALGVTCTYFLALGVSSMGEALLAGMLVAVVCVPVWNLASHHWIASTLGLATAMVLLADRWQDSERGRPASAGALTGLIVCTHQHRGLWIMAWLAIAIPMLARVRSDRHGWRRCLRELSWAAIGGAAICVPVLGYAVWRSSIGELLYATRDWVLSSYKAYNVGRVSWAGGWYPTIDGPYIYAWLGLFEAIPVLLGLEGGALLWAVWRDGLRSHAYRFAVYLLALAAVASIMYHPDYVHIAFIASYALVVLAGMAYRARTTFAFTSSRWWMTVQRLAWAIAVAAIVVKGWHNAKSLWAHNPYVFDTAFGTLAGPEIQSLTYADLQNLLARLHVEHPQLFSYPTDAWVYLTLPADNPTPFSLLRPRYNAPEQIRTAIDRLTADPRALVLLLRLVASNDPVLRFIQENYDGVGSAGPTLVPGFKAYGLFASKTQP